MGRDIVAQPLALRAQHQRDPGRPQRLGQRGLRLAGQPDPPEARRRHVVERAGEIDHPRPGHRLQRPARRLGQRARFARRVPVLRDDAERVERGGRAQDGADIVRVRDLIEHQQRPAVRRLVEQVGEQDVVQTLDLRDHALMRRVARHQPAEIGGVGEGDRDAGIDVEFRRRLARRPDADDRPLRIGERRTHGVAAPEAGAVLGLGRLAGLASHPYRLGGWRRG